jgi:hypothetical protein
MDRSILIAGGEKDPNIQLLTGRAKDMGVAVIPLLVSDEVSPSFFWDISRGDLFLMNEKVSPCAIFIRRDVFHAPGINKQDRSLAWYTSLVGWTTVNTGIKTLNRKSLTTYFNKLEVLNLAADYGLNIPFSYVTNSLRELSALKTESIAKPVMGGGYCQPLESVISDTEARAGATANPAIVQQRINGEDIRTYRVGEHLFGFRILSEAVDYRQTSARRILELKVIPEHIVKSLFKIMDHMGLNWGAADFKKCDKTGKWYFLEVNSNPMFSVFDKEAGGTISKAIIGTLLNP